MKIYRGNKIGVRVVWVAVVCLQQLDSVDATPISRYNIEIYQRDRLAGTHFFIMMYPDHNIPTMSFHDNKLS